MQKREHKVPLAAFSILFAASALALEVIYDGRTPEEHRQWADNCYLREQMEVAGRRICKALYGNEKRSELHENFTMWLYLAPVRGGNPAFAAGRRITCKVGEHPDGDASSRMGCLTHEMAHVLDMGSDRVFTEAMADWVRYYRVCTGPSGVLDRRYGALRGSRHYGKYSAGANFIDFMTQNYGEGTIYKILLGYRDHHGKVWEQLFGKTLDGLVAEWRQMETIYDPVWQWTYNATANGKVRNDRRFCSLGSIDAEDASDKSGAWLGSSTESQVKSISDGNMTIALHGCFPNGGRVAIASLGVARGAKGKAVLLAAAGKGALVALVVASVPGRDCGIVSSRKIPVPDLEKRSHSVVMSVRGGDEALVVVDGTQMARVDMKSNCEGCSFTPAFAVGGVAGGIGIPQIAEPRGKGGVLLDDVRVFNRAFRPRETKQYSNMFNARYRGGIATTAKWCGKSGDSIGETANWYCCNSLGERVWTLPSRDTDVTIEGRNLPAIPPGAKLDCKSFTIDGWAVADKENIDLRGVRIVDLADNTRLITRNGHAIAVAAIRGNRIRLDGKLAVTGGMKLSGNIEMKGGSVLRLPNDPDMAQAKSISIKGDGAVTLRTGAPLRYGHFQKLLRLETMPEDLTRFRLNPSSKPDGSVFRGAVGSKFIGVTPKRMW